MKFLLISSLLISAPTFAQSLDLAGLKKFMTTKKDTIESFRVGMSKKTTTTASVDIDGAPCAYTTTAIQSILKVEGERLIILSKESFVPAASEACKVAGYEASEDSVLYYENKPSLDQDLKDLDEASTAIKSIVKAGDLVTMNLVISDVDPQTNTTFSDNVTMKYDFSKSSFSNLILTQSNAYSISGQEMADIDLNTVDLKNVLFCEDNDSDRTDCMQGDFSDILF